jgi:demethoxyubiquinone hydroxylase (CLK1/Coq7/Cat5 family)
VDDARAWTAERPAEKFDAEGKMTYDITIIRPEMREEQVRLRGRDLGEDKRKALKKGLQTLHSLEIMATTIYKCQITKDATPLNTALTNAMSNEMTHTQDFQTRLYEYGFKPAKLRGRFWLAGYVFGLGSRMMGTERVLKTGIWVESKAVEHYGKLLAGAEWDDETRVFIEKDLADEYGHIARWKGFLESS